MNNTKEIFLKEDLVAMLKKLKSDEKGKWGIMNAQQMVEHFADAVKSANGKLVLPLLNEGERLQKSREFLLSEEPFKENIKNPLIPEEGFKLRKPDIDTAISKLQKELDYFFEIFEKHPGIKTSNPFFGQLDYDMNVQLLYKHAMHHLKQFGLV
jgi:hypothetical protein